MDEIKLLRKLPKNRSIEQIFNHYLVEKEIADRIKTASPDERKIIYATMYDELFARVPDHPRLSKRSDEVITAYANKRKFDLLAAHLEQIKTFVEFGCGDCRFTREVAKHVKFAYGIDISDQRNPRDHFPDNFKLIIYDGERISGIEPGSVDLVFSDYLVEHIHPDEIQRHFDLVHKLLKNKGLYIFRTPHFYSGPEDISGYFSDIPQGFHLKEYTCQELFSLIMEAGYSECNFIWEAKNIKLSIPYGMVLSIEKALKPLSGRVRRKLSRFIFPKILCCATK